MGKKILAVSALIFISVLGILIYFSRTRTFSVNTYYTMTIDVWKDQTELMNEKVVESCFMQYRMEALNKDMFENWRGRFKEKDPLILNLEESANTFWITRVPDVAGTVYPKWVRSEKVS